MVKGSPHDWLDSGKCPRTQVISSLQWDGGVSLVSYGWIFFLSPLLVIAPGYPTPLKHRSYKKRKENDSLEQPLSFKAKEVNLNPKPRSPVIREWPSQLVTGIIVSGQTTVLSPRGALYEGLARFGLKKRSQAE